MAISPPVRVYRGPRYSRGVEHAELNAGWTTGLGIDV